MQADQATEPAFRPLEGMRVVDLGQILAAPYATYQFALLGAEVIKIERPGIGDWTRHDQSVPELAAEGMGFPFATINGMKKSVEVDLKSPEGVAEIKKLCKTADVFVQNFKPGVAERLGLGFEAIRKENEKIVYCSISAYGHTGPFSGRPAYDHIIQATSGIMDATRFPGQPPTRVGSPFVDFVSGLNAAYAVMAALLQVKKIDKGVHVDISMLESAFSMMTPLVCLNRTTEWIPEPAGNEAWSRSPASGVFDTKEGLLAIAVNTPQQAEALCSSIGLPELAAAVDWTSAKDKSKKNDWFRTEIAPKLLERSAMDWEDTLNAVNVPAGAVRTVGQVLDSEQVQARPVTSRKMYPGGVEVHSPNLPFIVNGEVMGTRSVAPMLGEHNEMFSSVALQPVSRRS